MAKTKRTKKVSRSALVKKANLVISRFIRLNESDALGMCKCITCGAKMRWEEMHAGHFVHGLDFSWIEENRHPQCPRCNHYLSGALDKYTLWMLDTYGREIIDEIHKAKKEVIKSGEGRDREFLINVEKRYKEKFEKLLDKRKNMGQKFAN